MVQDGILLLREGRIMQVTHYVTDMVLMIHFFKISFESIQFFIEYFMMIQMYETWGHQRELS